MIVKLAHIIILVTWPIHLLAYAKTIAKPGCYSRCGEVDIPYPFGMNNGSKCYADKWFEIECRRNITVNASSVYYKPYLKSMGVEVTSIDASEGTVEIKNPIYRINCGKKDSLPRINQLGRGPFVYSQEQNKFVVVGCNNIAFLQSNGSDVSGCVSICDNHNDDISNLNLRRTECHGKSCCETSLPSNLSEYSPKIISLKENQTGQHHCSYAMIVHYSRYSSSSSKYNSGYSSNSYYFSIDGDMKDLNDVPAVLEWDIQNNTLKLPADDEFHYCQDSNVTSYHSGRRCTCKDGFEGNPYIAGGCKGKCIPAATPTFTY